MLLHRGSTATLLQKAYCSLSQCITLVPLPNAPRQCRGVPLPTAVIRWGKWRAKVPLPAAPTEGGSGSQRLHCPLPQGSVAVYCKSSTACRPHEVHKCGARLPRLATPGQCWGVPTLGVYRASSITLCSRVVQCTKTATRPIALRQCGDYRRKLHCPLPHGGAVCTAHFTRANAPWQCCSVLQEFDYPLPGGTAAMYHMSCTANFPKRM